MLILSRGSKRFDLPGADGVWFELRALPTDKDNEFVRETTEVVYDEGGKRPIDFKRDVSEYARKVGRYCILNWGNVCDPEGQPVPCISDAKADIMMLQPVEKFVMSKVRGLQILLQDEVSEAKKD